MVDRVNYSATRVVLHGKPSQRADLIAAVHHRGLIDAARPGVTHGFSFGQVVDLVAPNVGLDLAGDLVARAEYLVSRKPSEDGRAVWQVIILADRAQRLAVCQAVADVLGDSLSIC
tara:strand:- start:96 stop:443 length:348 start_codon:yes stop_codon:yes gene_type:complete